jgi:hypothetical protein
MKRFIAATTATACALSLVSCVKLDDNPTDPETIARAIPTANQVSIKLPETSARSLGQLASWYVATRDVTRMFNGGSAWVLVMIHTIVQFPVTTVADDIMTWGPWSDALSPAEYKLEVTVVGDGTFAYTLSGRSKAETTARFEAVIDGTADPRAGELKGSGEFLIDFDAARRINPVDGGDAKGSIDASYDLAARHLDLVLASSDALGQPVAASYAYNEAADGGGDMVFDIHGDVDGGAALESLTLRSRWLATGAGRADARIAGGDLGGVKATASECWSTAFKRVFYTDSIGFTPTEGAETACAFAAADLPAPE